MGGVGSSAQGLLGVKGGLWWAEEGCLGWGQGCAPRLSSDCSRKDRTLAFSLPVDPRAGTQLWALVGEAFFLLPPGEPEAQIVAGTGGGTEPARLPQSPEGWAGMAVGTDLGPRFGPWPQQSLRPWAFAPASASTCPRHWDRVEQQPSVPSRPMLSSPPQARLQTRQLCCKGNPTWDPAGTGHLVSAALRSTMIYH